MSSILRARGHLPAVFVVATVMFTAMPLWAQILVILTITDLPVLR